VPQFSTKVRHFRRPVQVLPTTATEIDERGRLVASLFAPLSDQMPGEYPPLFDPSPDVDVSKELFALCQRVQTEYLNDRGIDLLFDVSGGEMPATAYRKLEVLVESVIADIAQGPAYRTGGDLTLTVRRRGNVWVVGITERGGKTALQDCNQRRSTLARGLVQELNGTWRVEGQLHTGCITAFMFPAPTAAPDGQALTH